MFILHELWCNSIDQVARVQNGQMGGASMFPSKLFARALSTKEGEAKEEKKEEKKEEEPAAQSEVGGHADDQILHRPSREVVCCDKEMGVQGGEAKEEAKVETAEDKLAKAEEQIKTLEEEKKELKHKYAVPHHCILRATDLNGVPYPLANQVYTFIFAFISQGSDSLILCVLQVSDGAGRRRKHAPAHESQG